METVAYLAMAGLAIFAVMAVWASTQLNKLTDFSDPEPTETEVV